MEACKQIGETDQDLYRLLLEFRDYAVMRIDLSGRISSWNMGAEYIYGYTSAEVINQPLSTIYLDNDPAVKNADLLLAAARDEGRYVAEGWKKKKDGTPFYAYVIVTALYKDNKDLVGFAHVTRDITAKKNMEQENSLLRESLEERVKQRTRELEIVNKELEAFSYSVSHDLRTPLRAISGYSMMLKEDYEAKLDAEGNRLIDTILANTKMMGELIDDLLTFSKMARLEAIHDAVDMQQLVEHCLEKLTFSGTRALINTATLPACQGDASMLRQVWFNLLDNAIKYSSKKDNPQIEIGSKDDPNSHIYFIKDNGTGFQMKYANKLFGVFQRLHRQDEFEGTGLGLALAKRIVTKHGGEIWAEAEPQQGAIFYFSIPKTKHG